MAIIIAKTVISTIDIILTVLVIISTDDKTQSQRNVRVGAVVWTALNIAAMWL